MDRSLYGELLDDLEAEYQSLWDLVRSLPDATWSVPTPAPGWTVRDQIFHLAFYDELGVRAIRQPEAFRGERDAALAAGADFASDHADRSAAMSVVDLQAFWGASHTELGAALSELDGNERLDWFGPPMSARSFATARLMEVWAHGSDVAQGVGQVSPPTDRLRHVAHLGVATRGWSFVVRGLEPPGEPIRVELLSPGGELWTWGPIEADDRIRGSAHDFALVVTQRRNIDDTELAVVGDAAAAWMSVAQCFAGAPTLRAALA